MKETIISLFAALGCSASMMAQTDENALRINFTGTGNPVETEHMLEGTHITFSDDGEQMNLTVNDATVTYDLSNVSGMSHFCGTPTVVLHPKEDPEHPGNYFVTFYSGLEAYTYQILQAQALTAELDNTGDTYYLHTLFSTTLPRSEAVLFKSTSDEDIVLTVTDPSAGNKSANNAFTGFDVMTEQEDGYAYYMLTTGDQGLGFYKANASKPLIPNKAYIKLDGDGEHDNLSVKFWTDMVNGIDAVDDDANQNAGSTPSAIYSVSGIRQNKLQRGINIVNGKKVYVK